VRHALLAVTIVLLVAASTVLLGGGHPTVVERPAASLPLGGEPVHLDPARFTARIDHPYWPMRPGSRWVYRQTGGDDDDARRIEVTVTGRTRTILGIQARVVHDVVTEDGEVVEDTFDWYAQDREGTIWYFGEHTTEFPKHGKPSTEGSWKAGVDGAQPGIIMPADPRPGDAYRQEYYPPGKALDQARVLRRDARLTVRYGSFERVLVTSEFSPLEPQTERKYYARGVGEIAERVVKGHHEEFELVSVSAPRR
jgi:hypothetical protein